MIKNHFYLYNLDYLKIYLLLLYIKVILNKKNNIIIAILN